MSEIQTCGMGRRALETLVFFSKMIFVISKGDQEGELFLWSKVLGHLSANDWNILADPCAKQGFLYVGFFMFDLNMN